MATFLTALRSFLPFPIHFQCGNYEIERETSEGTTYRLRCRLSDRLCVTKEQRTPFAFAIDDAQELKR